MSKFSVEGAKKEQGIPVEKPVEYWMMVDKETLNPVRNETGGGLVCWAYYPGDKPAPSAEGVWIKVRATGETNED